MKFLHTSDWHVGRTIRTRSRLEEHRAVLQEITAIAKEEQVDAVFVTGDIFHDRRPPLEAEELIIETLAGLARTQIPLITIPGNHDDSSRIRILKPWGTLLPIHIVSDFSEELTSLIIPIIARDGKERALIGCLPYLHPHQVLSAAEGAGTSEDIRLSRYQSKIRDYFRALEEGMKQMDNLAVSVILAHVHVLGSVLGDGEWKFSSFPINADVLPTQVHYVALGHIHQPQEVTNIARYAGSILQMDFGECGQEKSVCLIEAHPGCPATISQIPLSQGKNLLRRVGTAEEILAQADDFKGAWVEVFLRPEERTFELVDQVRALPEVISLRFTETKEKREKSGLINHNAQSPAEILTDYYKIRHGGADPDPRLITLFQQLYQEENIPEETLQGL